MEWRAFVLKAKTKPGILFTDNGDLFTIRLARSETLCIDHSAGSPGEVFAPCRGIRIPDSGKFSLVDWFRNPGNLLWIRNLWALDSGIQLRESGIQFRIGIRTAVPGIRNPRHGIQNTRLSWIPWGESVKGVRLPVNGFIRKERFETETGPVRRLVEGNVKWQGMLKWSGQSKV